MFNIYSINDTVRVPPTLLSKDLNDSVLKILQQEYEGLLDEDLGIVIAIFDVENIGEGKIVPGDGSVYYNTNIKMLVYKPEL
ncbi:MAG: RPB7/RPC8 family DNA-directed RNA polymerase subunit, partial [archaeon]